MPQLDVIAFISQYIGISMDFTCIYCLEFGVFGSCTMNIIECLPNINIFFQNKNNDNLYLILAAALLIVAIYIIGPSNDPNNNNNNNNKNKKDQKTEDRKKDQKTEDLKKDQDQKTEDRPVPYSKEGYEGLYRLKRERERHYNPFDPFQKWKKWGSKINKKKKPVVKEQPRNFLNEVKLLEYRRDASIDNNNVADSISDSITDGVTDNVTNTDVILRD